MKIISKISKILSAFMLSALVIFTDVSVVNADAKSSINTGAATLLPGYIAGVKYYIKTVKGGGYAYCLNIKKATTHDIKANLAGTMDAGIAYIIENGYPNKSFTGDKKKDYYITQGAIYWYLDETAGMSNLGNAYKSTGSDSYNLRKYVKKLVEGAKKAKKTGYVNPSLSLKVANSNMTISSDGQYFVSNTINANAKNITDKYTVKIDSAPAGTIITNVNGAKQTKFKSSENFLVKVPVTSVEEGKTVTVKVTVGAYRKYNKAYKYLPTNNSMQPLAINVPFTKTVEKSIKLVATRPVKPKCQYDKTNNKYYDKDGNVTTKETYIAQCTTPKACSYNSEFDVYFDKSGKIVSKTVYENECLPKKYCQYDKDQNKYFGKAGNEVTKEVYESECSEPSKVVINKIDKNTNNPIAGATLVVKDANKNIIQTFTSTVNGYEIKSLSNGTYTVEETKAPAGYKLNSTPVEFTISDTQKNVEVKFYNEPISSVVTINKVDGATLKNVAGAEILVTNSDGEQVASFTSTTDSYTLKDLPYGTYTVEEITAPEGYFLNEEKQTFTIDENHLSAQVTIKNIPKTCENGGLDENECYVEVPNTGTNTTLFSLIGLAVISLGIGYVYKNNKNTNK